MKLPRVVKSLVARAPVAAGPLALAGFFLPWARGSGPLTGESFSGFEMLRVLGALQASEVAFEGRVQYLALRVLSLGVPVAAAWVTMLAPACRWHWAYPVAAGYLAAAALSLVLFVPVITGTAPMSGGLLLLFCAMLLLAPLALRTAPALRWRERVIRAIVPAA